MSEYFPEPKSSRANVKAELDLSNYATKADLKNATDDENDDHAKYIITEEFNKLTLENFASGLAQANLASKNDFVNFVKKTDFDDKLKNLNKKVTSNKTKHVLVENKVKNYRHLAQAFLLVKVTLVMTNPKISSYFNQFTKLLLLFLVFQRLSQNGNLKDCEMKKLVLLI